MRIKILRLYGFVAICMISVALSAQTTSLEINCQNPGWLSSKIDYKDQKTIQNIKVTGYINSVDLKFIGEMISKQSLRGCIDLENANIVGTSASNDNVMPNNSFSIGWNAEYPNGYTVSRLKLPLSITKMSNCLNEYLLIDTLDIGGYSMPVITKTGLYDRTRDIYESQKISLINFREGVTEIDDFAFYDSHIRNNYRLTTVYFPSTLTYIGRYAFSNCKALEHFNLPDNIENIEECAFSDTSYNPDTIELPKNLKKYHMRAIPSATVLMFGEKIDSINNTFNASTSNGLKLSDVFNSSAELEFHVDAMTPPVFICIDTHCLENSVVYVSPNSTKEYENVDVWKYATIKSVDIPTTGVVLNVSEFTLDGIGATTQLIATVSPENAVNKNVRWRSSNETICIVTNGNVVAVGYGTAVIIATTEEGEYMAVCTITVEENSGVNNVSESSTSMHKIYSIDGKEITGFSKGVNIVVFDDGTTKKIIKK